MNIILGIIAIYILLEGLYGIRKRDKASLQKAGAAFIAFAILYAFTYSA